VRFAERHLEALIGRAVLAFEGGDVTTGVEDHDRQWVEAEVAAGGADAGDQLTPQSQLEVQAEISLAAARCACSSGSV
jgi:hypothetical protein